MKVIEEKKSYDLNTVLGRIKYFLNSQGLSASSGETIMGFSHGRLSQASTNVTCERIARLHKQFPALNTEWIMYHEGEMMLSPSLGMKNRKPYYDCDFEYYCTHKPEAHSYFVVANSDRADFYVNSGQSFGDTIIASDIIALQNIKYWSENLIAGYIYAVEMGEGRGCTIREVRAQSNKKSEIQLVMPDGYVQNVNKSVIKNVYRVIGIIRKL